MHKANLVLGTNVQTSKHFQICDVPLHCLSPAKKGFDWLQNIFLFSTRNVNGALKEPTPYHDITLVLISFYDVSYKTNKIAFKNFLFRISMCDLVFEFRWVGKDV